MFCGSVDDVFFVMDDAGAVQIFDVDSIKHFNDLINPKFEEKHLVRNLMSRELIVFQNKALEKLKNTDFKERGCIFDSEIEHYETYFKDFEEA